MYNILSLRQLPAHIESIHTRNRKTCLLVSFESEVTIGRSFNLLRMFKLCFLVHKKACTWIENDDEWVRGSGIESETASDALDCLHAHSDNRAQQVGVKTHALHSACL